MHLLAVIINININKGKGGKDLETGLSDREMNQIKLKGLKEKGREERK